MTDRELLELAAKAAGIEIKTWSLGNAIINSDSDMYPVVSWNPLTSDGDALRLAVKLNIDFKAYEKTVITLAIDSAKQEIIASVSELTNDDPYAATRRAIVRAAAEIGNGMK